MSADPAPDRISAELGETWNLTSKGYKLYPSGSLTHPTVDGVIALVTGDDVAPGDVTVIDVRVSPPAARFTDPPRPTNRMQAKLSLRHCAARRWSSGGSVRRSCPTRSWRGPTWSSCATE
jgi:hypothetical protein